ncbi:tetratricopeptide repeat protein [candidate division CSSED10-310 bacterium]|uniref:Tetratricopeptide repeat protein n=1 Tax=candidate division CSSED10-310 bacterium TaxID=2855610 RepID=A0ABV6YRT1_UNCC1
MNPGTIIGQYEVIEIVGQGGMGVVYRAQHRVSGEHVALKTIGSVNEYSLGRIRGEIRTLARIQHPGIVRIRAEGVHDGFPWYAMELITGVTLQEYFFTAPTKNQTKTQSDTVNKQNTDSIVSMTQEPSRNISQTGSRVGVSEFKLDMTESLDSSSVSMQSCGRESDDSAPALYPELELVSALDMIVKICEPLAYLHGEGIVHRDLKPDNIIIQVTDQPVIVDFGLFSRFSDVESRESLEVERAGAGTVPYIAPEQIRGECVDSRADLYALGCILYELLTGYYAFYDPDPEMILRAHLFKPPRPPSQLNPNIGPELDDLVLRLLAKDPRNRIGYAGSVAMIAGRLIGRDQITHTGPEPKDYLYRSRFAGRSQQVVALTGHFQNLLTGQGGLVLVGGESGIGKTRLLMEFGRDAARHDVIVLTGTCTEYSGRPFEALLKPLQWIADYCRSKGVAVTEHLLGKRGLVFAPFVASYSGLPGLEKFPEPEELPVQDARTRLFRYLSETLKILAQERPLLLILDDLHWSDELVSLFLSYFVRFQQQDSFPVLIVGAYRQEEVPSFLHNIISSSHVSNITINRLADNAVEVIVGDMLAMKPAPEALRRYLARHSEGNPFFVAEYLRAAVDHDYLFRDRYGNWQLQQASVSKLFAEDDQTFLPLPSSVHGLINRRLDKLSPAARSVLQAVAVIGRETDERLLTTMTDLSDDELLDSISEIELRHIAERTEQGLITFVHAQIQKVALETVPEDERGLLHLSAAHAIEQLFNEQREDYLADLGHHYEQAGKPIISCKYYYDAAQKAKKLHQIDFALDYLTRVIRFLELADTGAQLKHDLNIAEIYKERAELLELSAQYDSALQDYDNSIRLTRNELLKGLGNLSKAKIEEIRGNMEQARLYFHAALSFTTNDNLEKARILLNLAWFEGEMQGRHEEAEQLCSQTRDLILDTYPDLRRPLSDIINDIDSAPENIEAADLLAMTERYRGVFALGLCHYNQARHSLEEALAYFRKRGLKRKVGGTSNNLGNLFLLSSDLDKALEHMQNYLTISEEIGNRRGLARASSSLGHIYFYKGDYNLALEYHERDRLISEEIGDKRGLSMALGNLGLIYHFKGESDQALKFLHQCQTLNQAINYRPGVAMALGNIGMIHLTRGEFQPALEYLWQDHSLSEELGDKRGQGISLDRIGMVHSLQGDVNQAKECYTRSLTLLEEIGEHYYQGIVLLDLAELSRLNGDFARSMSLIESARLNFVAVNSESCTARCYLNFAECELDRGDVAQAKEALQKAIEIYKLHPDENDEGRLKLVSIRIALKECTIKPGLEPEQHLARLIADASDLLYKSRQRQLTKLTLETMLLLGQVLLLGLQHQEARQVLEEARELARKHGYKPLEQTIVATLSEVHP